jgi:hypothetical protein
MKKVILLVALATLAGLALAQNSLVGTYERYGLNLRNEPRTQVDYQPLHPPCRTENVISTIQDGVAGALGEVLYYYRNSTPCNSFRQPLRKPIIVLDGFDPGDKRAGQELDNITPWPNPFQTKMLTPKPL